MLIFLALFLTGCHFAGSRKGSPPPVSGQQSQGGIRGTKSYTVRGKTYYPLVSAQGFREDGIASWYGRDFHGKKTANGERYNMYGMTAAHKTLPLGTMVRVTNKSNGRSIVVRINDRGPFVNKRIIDLTKTGAQKLDMLKAGTAPVRIEALGGSSSVKTSRRKGKISSRNTVNSVGTSFASSRQADKGEGQFFIQTGAFSTKPNAQSALETLKNKGITARIVHTSGSPMWRVQAGPYATQSQAENANKTIKGFVVTE